MDAFHIQLAYAYNASASPVHDVVEQREFCACQFLLRAGMNMRMKLLSTPVVADA
jgi:hypothetical protein